MINLVTLANFVKFRILSQSLKLHKTHDFCASKNPQVAVIFLHGIASSSATFHNTLKYLEGTSSLKDVRFLTYDWLGSGKSFTSDHLDYDYDDQIIALHHTIEKLKLNIPLILVGHSMGSLIATRYAHTYKQSVKQLILVSPPIFTPSNLRSPTLKQAMNFFIDSVARRQKNIIKQKSFTNSMEHIVKNDKNFRVFTHLKTPTILIYGTLDTIIAPFNIHKVVKENRKYLSSIKTRGKHSMSRDKYIKILNILEKFIHENL